MTTATPTAPTFAETAWTSASAPVRAVVLMVLGSILLTISAKIQIPFIPVPQTMQTLVVLMVGAAYGWRLGAATVMFYLVQGAAGLPVFAGTPEKGIGIAYLMGPTGGYLAGFVVAAAAVGWLAERGWDRNFFTTIAAMTLGATIIYALGLAYLGALFGWDKPILEWGFYPFVLGDITKVLLGAFLMPMAWSFLKRRG